jgi:hypothetical protein
MSADLRSSASTTCSSAQDELHCSSGKQPSEVQSLQQTTCGVTSLQHVSHERPHAMQRRPNSPQNAASSSGSSQTAVQAAPGAQALQGAAALQHNAVPLNRQPVMYRPLARRVVYRQIQHPVQHERSTLTTPGQLQLSQQPVQKDTRADSKSGIGEHEGLASMPTMICYPASQTRLLPPKSFVRLVGDSPVEQTVIDSRRKVAVTRIPQAALAAKSAQAKKPKRRLSTRRQVCC